MAEHPIRRALTRLGEWTGHSAAFWMVPVYGVGWYVFDKDSFNWHSVAVLATWFMTLLIQRAEHRDTLAIHAKLDELLRVQGEARNELMTIDREDPEDIEQRREQEYPPAQRAAADRPA